MPVATHTTATLVAAPRSSAQKPLGFFPWLTMATGVSTHENEHVLYEWLKVLVHLERTRRSRC